MKTFYPFIFLVLLASGARGTEYLYTVQVDTLDPRESPITVVLTWPGGARTNILAKRGMVSTTKIQPHGGDFSLTVAISKPLHFPWQKTYIHGDFVPMQDGARQIVEKVRLRVKPKLGTAQQLEELSQALPLGLTAYSEISLSDDDRDGVPDEAWLIRRTSDTDSPYQGLRRSQSQSPYAELRRMRLRDGEWHCAFLANHRGVFVGGKRVPGTPAAPFGYHFGGRTHDAGLIYDNLYTIDANGRRLSDGIQRSYIWRTGQDSVEVISFDKSKPDTLIPLIRDKSVLIRMRAARALAASRHRAAVKPLIDALLDKNPFARSSIAASLESITGERFGQDHDKWVKWYRESQQPLPHVQK